MAHCPHPDSPLLRILTPQGLNLVRIQSPSPFALPHAPSHPAGPLSIFQQNMHFQASNLASPAPASGPLHARFPLPATSRPCLALPMVGYFSHFRFGLQDHLFAEAAFNQVRVKPTLRWEARTSGWLRRCWSGEGRLKGVGEQGRQRVISGLTPWGSPKSKL